MNNNELVTIYNCGLNTAGKKPALMTVSDIAFFPPPLGDGMKMTRSHAVSLKDKWPMLFTLDRGIAQRNKKAFERGTSPDELSIDEIERQIELLNAKKREMKKEKKGVTE